MTPDSKTNAKLAAAKKAWRIATEIVSDFNDETHKLLKKVPANQKSAFRAKREAEQIRLQQILNNTTTAYREAMWSSSSDSETLESLTRKLMDINNRLAD